MIGKTCLLVEDEALIALDLEDVLAEAGFAILGPFASIVSAREAVQDQRPDVALLDTHLIDGPCIGLALELRAAGVPIVILSGNSERREADVALEGIPWLVKPAQPADVVATVTAALVSHA